MDAYLIVPGKLNTHLYQSASGHPILPSVGDVVIDVDGDKVVVKSIEWYLDNVDTAQVWVRAEPYSEPSSEHHDDQTIKKVYDILRLEVGMDPETCANVISRMQKEGILFREMGRGGK